MIRLARIALWALAVAHVAVAAWGTAPLDTPRFRLAGAILGLAYGALARSSRDHPVQGFGGGFGLLALSVVLGSVTGLWPLGSWPVFKAALLAVLAFAAAAGWGRDPGAAA